MFKIYGLYTHHRHQWKLDWSVMHTASLYWHKINIPIKLNVYGLPTQESACSCCSMCHYYKTLLNKLECLSLATFLPWSEYLQVNLGIKTFIIDLIEYCPQTLRFLATLLQCILGIAMFYNMLQTVTVLFKFNQ